MSGYQYFIRKSIVGMAFLWALLLLSTPVFAQPRLTDTQQHMWLISNGTHPIAGKFSWMHDFQFRRADLGKNPQQLLLRAGISYEFHPGITATIGYGFIETYPYGGLPVSKTFSEHRFWQQVQAKGKVGKVDFTHRYRLEQRVIETFPLHDVKYNRLENRMRYLIRLSTPLKSWEKQKLYALAYDELFVNFGDEVGYNVFDQNRLSVGLGYSFNPKVSLELGYMNQHIQQRGITLDDRMKFENNHTLTITNTFNF